ncbi:MAG: hypothetical protein JXA20_19775 [Spirochaetes bacterium]|nr:hypothetical protein [Spirochaetota bacterium]
MLFRKTDDRAESPAPGGFAGRWHSTFGPLTMEVVDTKVTGSYRFGTIDGTLEGRIEGSRLNFRYREPQVSGEGWFELLRPGRFRGLWRPDGSEAWHDWTGERGFDGIWATTFGLMKLAVEEGEQIMGFYEMGGPSDITGTAAGNEMSFSYREPAVSGEGSFILSDDTMGFSGKWRPDGETGWQPWEGRRVLPAPGIVWLVVLEAHWQRYLNDREYSFGAMLDEFFARLPHVNVSHRFFTDEEGLRQWCRSLLYLPEPVYLVVASHATEEGLSVLGKTIGTEVIADSLLYADSLRLLHFSSCLLMNDNGGKAIRGLHSPGRFPVSGYTTSVNWAASAIIEFCYLDLVLEQGLSPSEAAKRLVTLMPFAGTIAPKGSPFPAAGFRIIDPD